MSRIAFSSILHGNFDVLRLALEAAALPTGDIAEPDREFFQLSGDQGPLGFVGLEGSGSDRLMRSLVVLPSNKRKGYGGLLVAHVERFARQGGVERLHLHTIGAAGFFRACGYRAADRATAPAPISGSAQFVSLCPANAAYLIKEFA